MCGVHSNTAKPENASLNQFPRQQGAQGAGGFMTTFVNPGMAPNAALGIGFTPFAGQQMPGRLGVGWVYVVYVYCPCCLAIFP